MTHRTAPISTIPTLTTVQLPTTVGLDLSDREYGARLSSAVLPIPAGFPELTRNRAPRRASSLRRTSCPVDRATTPPATGITS